MYWAIILMQIQPSQDFKLKVEFVNIPQIKRDLDRDWTAGIEVVDEDSRATYYVGEKLNLRAAFIKSRVRMSNLNNGDNPSYVINRIRYPVERTIETPRTFELMEWLISDYFYNTDIDAWKKRNSKLMSEWNDRDHSRRWNFLKTLNKEDFLYDYDIIMDHYDLYAIYFKGSYTTLEKLGYKEAPKPTLFKEPSKPIKPYFLR